MLWFRHELLIIKMKKMKKIILLIALIGICSCSSPSKISEDQVMASFENFFNVLDNDLDNLGTLVTEDFFIFENSRRYSKEEFIELVKTFDIISSKRRFENIKIDSDINSAHISLTQFGEFIINTPEGKVRLDFEWLESTYLIKTKNGIKFKFYFSEAIKTNTTPL